MPRIPIDNARRGGVYIPRTLAGTDRLTAQALDQSVPNALMNAAATVQATRTAEANQEADLRVAVLQQQLQTAELEAATTIGPADDYLEEFSARRRELFEQATAGVDGYQSRRMAPKLKLLEATVDFAVKQRELSKRVDAGRASLAQQESFAISTFANPESSLNDRKFAQGNYFDSLDSAVETGLYTGVEAETLKKNFLKNSALAEGGAAEANFIAFHSTRIMEMPLSARQKLKMIDGIEGPADWKQNLRNELEDRIARDERLRLQEDLDYSGSLALDIMANPGSYTLAQIKSDPRLRGRYRDDVARVYVAARDGNAETVDDPVILNELYQMAADDPKAFAKLNLVDKIRGKDGRLLLTPKTAASMRQWQNHLYTQGERSDEMDRTVKGLSVAQQMGTAKGLKGVSLLKFKGAYAQAYASAANPPKTYNEQIQLADQILQEVERPWPWSWVPFMTENLGGFYQLSKEQLNEYILETDTNEWPPYLTDRVFESLVQSIMEKDNLTLEEAQDKALLLQDDDAAIRRHAQQMLLEPLSIDIELEEN